MRIKLDHCGNQNAQNHGQQADDCDSFLSHVQAPDNALVLDDEDTLVESSLESISGHPCSAKAG